MYFITGLVESATASDSLTMSRPTWLYKPVNVALVAVEQGWFVHVYIAWSSPTQPKPSPKPNYVGPSSETLLIIFLEMESCCIYVVFQSNDLMWLMFAILGFSSLTVFFCWKIDTMLLKMPCKRHSSDYATDLESSFAKLHYVPIARRHKMC